jgi:hypothetical protein
VIELDIVYDHQFGKIVKKLRSLVEEGGVVLISLDNEVLRLPQARPLTEVRGNASDKITRLEIGAFENPGQQ